MAPLREARSWTVRYEEEIEIEPLRRYYLIFEGANTERKYFQGIEGYRKELGINTLIELVILHKEGEIRNYSHPHKLLELINVKKDELKGDGNFDEKIDQFVIVFDRDSFEKKDDYFEFLEVAGKNNSFTITSPYFEIWLLLHYDDAIIKYINPERTKIIENNKVSSAHSFTSKLFSDIAGVNPKRNVNFPKIKEHVNLAIEQEKLLVQDNISMFEEIGSNVGILIEEMRKDPREIIF
ncbi:MAG: hypothetical protein COA82_10870 [Alkaliphilus sp.]|nr:RloB domain-containing protein [Alkaliphilus sp. AH-315-G20]PHS30945.1 MAG: hypothetical protein COA82_10870 [Alkaliphilus sp.]